MRTRRSSRNSYCIGSENGRRQRRRTARGRVYNIILYEPGDHGWGGVTGRTCFRWGVPAVIRSRTDVSPGAASRTSDFRRHNTSRYRAVGRDPRGIAIGQDSSITCDNKYRKTMQNIFCSRHEIHETITTENTLLYVLYILQQST